MGSNRVAHRGQAARSVYALITTLLLGVLAGCGSSTQGADRFGSTPTVTASPRDNETPTATASTNWATYTNTKYGFTIEYPTGWYPSDTSPTAGGFDVYSYDSSKVSGYPLPDVPLQFGWPLDNSVGHPTIRLATRQFGWPPAPSAVDDWIDRSVAASGRCVHAELSCDKSSHAAWWSRMRMRPR